MEKQTNKEELLKAVADVLDEALAEYEKLAKWEDMQMAEDPTRPAPEKEAGMEEGQAQSPDMAEEKDEEDKEEEKEVEEEGDEEDKMDDETLKSKYAKMCAKMEKRGLMKKSEEKVEEVKKSEAPAAEDKTETLRKSVDDRFDSLTKAIAEISATVNKIASAPARKGVAGYQPLRKSEEGEAQPLNKAEIIGKLLDLKKSGKYVDTALINRIETGRTSEADAQAVKQLLG
jgi:hypothetical protein